VIGRHVDNSTRQIDVPNQQRVGRLTQLLAEDVSGQGVAGILPRAAAPGQPQAERPGAVRTDPVDQALADQRPLSSSARGPAGAPSLK
jgi:hypothetical protein